MKIFGKSKCLKDWQIQAYIDKELDDDTLLLFSAHVEKCDYCKKRVEAKRKRIETVIGSLNIIQNYSFAGGLDENPKPTIRNFKNYIIGVSVAASVVIAALFFKHQTNNSTSISEDDCKWVALSSNEFQPELESPNRLFRMRAVKCEELSRDSSLRVTYLVKTCKQ
ncbi:hypothetical protein CYCD_14460 [Tenuifilaceae bacterium CYCD]|nr:hypothetical protein CYCD_14460 [Tenuifilaceae bacterium CYCD]